MECWSDESPVARYRLRVYKDVRFMIRYKASIQKTGVRIFSLFCFVRYAHSTKVLRYSITP